MTNLTKIYKENYRHKHTLKYIRSVVEKYMDPKFKFTIKSIDKTFTPANSFDRIWYDYDIDAKSKEILEQSDNKVRPSYTIDLDRKNELYEDLSLHDYKHIIECMIDMDKDFSKKNLKLVPDDIESKMSFDVVEENYIFDLIRDNANISDFLNDLLYKYETYQSRNYRMVIDDKLFYQVYLDNGYNADNESSNIENIRHFSDFLEKYCTDNDFKCLEVDNYKFNIYTKRQFRMLKLKSVLS